MNNLRKSMGLNNMFRPYEYEKFKAVNPLLSKKMYQYLRENGTEWKILIGFPVKIKWSNEVLKPLWFFDEKNYKNDIIYKNRYNSDFISNCIADE